MITFKTITGSVYQIDRKNKQFRRLEGIAAPQPRVGTDGTWKPYHDISNVTAGQSVLIVWAIVDGSDGEAVMQSTATSPVVEIHLETGEA